MNKFYFLFLLIGFINADYIISIPDDLNNPQIYGKDNTKLKGQIIDNIFDVETNFTITIELNNKGIFNPYPYNLLFYNGIDKKNRLSIILNQSFEKTINNIETAKIEYIKNNKELIIKVNNTKINIIDDEYDFKLFESIQKYYPRDKDIIIEINKNIKKINYYIN